MHDAVTRTATDVMDPARARALQATLGIAPSIEAGDPLPPFFHHLHFWDPVPPDRLGRDGHPARGEVLPDLGLPRRMWGAGRLLFHAPLLAGSPADRSSTVEAVTRKDGRSGPLGLVRLRHDIRQRQALVLTEWQDLVYRPDPDKGAPPPEPPIAPDTAEASEEVRFDTTTLFRYSALTFNGHRIHYDRPYARRVEGYADLVVHGPLLAQLLILFGQRMLARPLTEVTYRATAPLTLPQPALLCWSAGAAWVRGPGGIQCMTARFR